jgi:hypothetical protein
MRICPRCGNIIKDDDDVCWHCYVCDKRPGPDGNTSTNIGIPEKRRGWELADIQYHGGQFYSGEW